MIRFVTLGGMDSGESDRGRRFQISFGEKIDGTRRYIECNVERRTNDRSGAMDASDSDETVRIQHEVL